MHSSTGPPWLPALLDPPLPSHHTSSLPARTQVKLKELEAVLRQYKAENSKFFEMKERYKSRIAALERQVQVCRAGQAVGGFIQGLVRREDSFLEGPVLQAAFPRDWPAA